MQSELINAEMPAVNSEQLLQLLPLILDAWNTECLSMVVDTIVAIAGNFDWFKR